MKFLTVESTDRNVTCTTVNDLNEFYGKGLMRIGGGGWSLEGGALGWGGIDTHLLWDEVHVRMI